jgi:DNA repair protein RadC
LDDRNIRADALEFALRAVKCGLWAWDLENNELAWSPEAAAILGVREIEPSIEGFLSLIHSDDVGRARVAFTRALAEGSTIYLEFRRKAPEGGVDWFACHGTPRYDKKGVARQIIGAIFLRREEAVYEGLSDFADGQRFGDRNRGLAPARLAQLREELSTCLAGSNDVRRARVQEEILAFFLWRIVPPDVAKRHAAALMERFGSLATMAETPPAVLATVEGVDERHLLLFEVMRLAIQCMLRPTREPVQFISKDAIVAYLRVAQANMAREQLRVVFLDQSRHIICDEVMQEGTVDHTPVYVREIVKRALELSASSIILAHNHPSGNLEPSFEDIVTTQRIVRAARPLGIAVDDHIILTRHGHASLRELHLMEDPASE